jgi:serine/threonine protein kinase
MRQKICVGIARGMAFMHEESTLKIVHRDIKSTNVLLDRDLNPKISDFGLAKLDEEETPTSAPELLERCELPFSFSINWSLLVILFFLFILVPSDLLA